MDSDNQFRNTFGTGFSQNLSTRKVRVMYKRKHIITGVTTVKVLTALDALDRHSFERVDAGNSLDTLYTKIFPMPCNNKDNPTNQEDGRVQYVSNV